MYSAGIEPETLVMAELRSNCNANKDRYTFWKNAHPYNLFGGRGRAKNDPF